MIDRDADCVQENDDDTRLIDKAITLPWPIESKCSLFINRHAAIGLDFQTKPRGAGSILRSILSADAQSSAMARVAAANGETAANVNASVTTREEAEAAIDAVLARLKARGAQQANANSPSVGKQEHHA